LLELAPRVKERIERLTITGWTPSKHDIMGISIWARCSSSKNDVVIIDFEGEPRRSMEERRRKHSALKDVGRHHPVL